MANLLCEISHKILPYNKLRTNGARHESHADATRSEIPYCRWSLTGIPLSSGASGQEMVKFSFRMMPDLQLLKQSIEFLLISDISFVHEAKWFVRLLEGTRINHICSGKRTSQTKLSHK